jgi:hypothetical protein
VTKFTILTHKINVEKPPRNSAGFCGGGQGLSWAVEPRKEERKKERKKDSRNSDKTAPSGRELYHLQFSLQAASPETFGYTLGITQEFLITFEIYSEKGNWLFSLRVYINQSFGR